MLRLVSGFASAYGLELLATVHWVMTREGDSVTDDAALTRLVQGWSQRKGRLFTNAHLRTATEHLVQLGWLAA